MTKINKGHGLVLSFCCVRSTESLYPRNNSYILDGHDPSELEKPALHLLFRGQYPLAFDYFLHILSRRLCQTDFEMETECSPGITPISANHHWML